MMRPRPHLTLLTLGVDDLPRAVAFYEAWGLERAGFESEGVAFFDMGGTAIAVYPNAAVAADADLTAHSGGFRGVTLGWNRPDRASVDQTIADALACGATLQKEAHEAFWGGYSGFIADPDGHIWEIAFNPGWALRDNGAMELPQPAPSSRTS